MFAIEHGIPIPPRRVPKSTTCSFCGKPEHCAKGFCRKCYKRASRNGSLEYRIIPGESTEEKIRRLTRIDGNCHLWLGCFKYGKPICSHRYARLIAYELKFGKQPVATRFKPTCGNATCINPDHMATSKLVDHDAIEAAIRKAEGLSRREAAKSMYATGMTLQQVSDVLGVTKERVRQLVHDVRHPWKQRAMAERIAAIEQFLVKECSVEQIAQELEISRGSVSYTIRKYVIRK